MNRLDLRNILSAYLPKLVSFIAGPFIFVLLTKRLSVGQLGIYEIFLQTSILSIVLFTLGLPRFAAYRVPGEPKSLQGEVFWSGLFFQSCLYLSAVFLILLPLSSALTDMLNLGLSPVYFWSVPLLWTLFLVEQEGLRFIGYIGNIPWKSTLASLEIALFATFLYFLTKNSITVEKALLCHLLSFSTIGLLSYSYIWKSFPGSFKKIKQVHLKQGLIYGLPLVFLNIGDNLLQITDRYIIAGFMDTEAVGFYSYALSYNKIAYNAASPFFWALYPAFAAYFKSRNIRKSNEMLSFELRYGLFAFLSLALFLVCLRGFLIPILSREEYLSLDQLYWFFLINILFFFLSTIFQQTLLLSKLTKVLGLAYIIAGCFNLLLNIVLVPIYGIKGAILATLVANGSILGTCLYFTWKRTWITIPSHLLLPVLVFGLAWFGFLKFVDSTLPDQVSIWILALVGLSCVPLGILTRILRFEDLAKLMGSKY